MKKKPNIFLMIVAIIVFIILMCIWLYIAIKYGILTIEYTFKAYGTKIGLAFLLCIPLSLILLVLDKYDKK